MEKVKMDIQNTKEVLVLMVKAGEAFKLANADKKIDFNDLGYLMTVLPAAQPAINDIGLIPKELGDLDEAEMSELKNLILADLGGLMGEEKLLLQISAGLDLLHAGYKFYNTIK